MDDWAFRKGQRYGTILVDLEQGQTIDLLGDCQSETLAQWLREHPGVEVVTRDRASAYADGIKQGAPTAVQVADRWHLLQNCREALQRLMDRHQTALRQVKIRSATAPLPADSDSGSLPCTRRNRTASPAEQQRQERRTRRLARYEEVKALHRQGVSQ